jgi:diguanylate cyclase (GGDEF)-like protein
VVTGNNNDLTKVTDTMLTLVRPDVFRLEQAILEHNLRTVFQPVVSLKTSSVIGFEGLTRGQEGTQFESPVSLFTAAEQHQLSSQLDRNCQRRATSLFAERNLPGKLFLNVLASSIVEGEITGIAVTTFLEQLNLKPEQIVLEITESQPITNFARIKQHLDTLRSIGFQIAIDDLGEAYASLKLWLELRPDYVKIDKAFVSNMHQDSYKLQFVRAIKQIGEFTNTMVIAEGIETEAELLTIRDLGIEHAQGYFLGRPVEVPSNTISPAAKLVLASRRIAVLSSAPAAPIYTTRIGKLATPLEPASVITTNEVLMRRFNADPNLFAIPVVVDGVPVGMVRRSRFVHEFARPFRHELYDKRPCALFMDNDPLIVEASTTIPALSELLTDSDRRHLASGFIITEQQRYLGVGSGQALVRELTEMQINTARYANPLTMLPGNVPIDEHVERLLGAKIAFNAAYIDIDHFKPYNDLYGYRKGDEMIRALGSALVDAMEPTIDFVGHVGGDDFIAHLQSGDWEIRLHNVIAAFDRIRGALLTPEDHERGTYITDNRSGEKQALPTPTISIGVVKVEIEMFASAHDVAAALAEAKREAKKISGSSLFIERRKRNAA